jgi:oligopeptide transport system ATP-binding protein
MGLILITHDLGVVAEVADRVNVMYAGGIVETGTIDEVYRRPAHPYSEGLMRSIPRADMKGQELTPITGQPPDLRHIPPGCAFHPRCPYMRDNCTYDDPPQYHVDGPERVSACHYWQEVIGAE